MVKLSGGNVNNVETNGRHLLEIAQKDLSVQYAKSKKTKIPQYEGFLYLQKNSVYREEHEKDRPAYNRRRRGHRPACLFCEIEPEERKVERGKQDYCVDYK